MYKVKPSIFNVAVTLLVTGFLALCFQVSLTTVQILAVTVFFAYNFICESVLGCCGGMRIFKRKWRVQKTVRKKMVYIVCYTASFGTFTTYVWIPLDLFVINMVFFQLPCVLLTGNTFHGYLGDMETVDADTLPGSAS